MNDGANDWGTYEVRVQGRLSESWSDWLGAEPPAFQETQDGRGMTILRCQLDQAALRGLLTRLWDLGLTVVSCCPAARP